MNPKDGLKYPKGRNPYAKPVSQVADTDVLVPVIVAVDDTVSIGHYGKPQPQSSQVVDQHLPKKK